MITCSNCHPNCNCCDFCKHFDFNADDLGQYTGNGWCNLNERRTEPWDDCGDFHCSEAVDFADILKRLDATYSPVFPYEDLCAAHLKIIKEVEHLLIDVTEELPKIGSHVLAVEDLTSIGRGIFLGDYWYTHAGFCVDGNSDDAYGFITKWCYIKP